MKVLVAVAALIAVSTLGLGALLSHGPQLGSISWSRGTRDTSDGWSQDIRLTDAPLDSMQPSLARDAQDNLHIVWSDDRTGEPDIYYKKVDVTGKVLVGDQRLSGTLSQSLYPAIAADSEGGLHVAWLDDRGGMWNIYYARLSNDGQVVVAGLQITSYGLDTGSLRETPYTPQPARQTDQLSALTNFAGRPGASAPGGMGQSEIRETPPASAGGGITNIEGMRPSIAVDGSGRAHLAWADFRNGNGEVRYTVIDAQGAIAVDQERISMSTSDSYNAVLRVWGDETIIVWAERSGETNSLRYARLDPAGDFLVPPRDILSERSQRMEVDAAVDAEGNTRLVWSSDRSLNNEIYYIDVPPDGEPATRESQVTRSVLNSMHPSIAVDSSGNVHVAWSEEQERSQADRHSGSDIYYAVLAPDGTRLSGGDRITGSPWRSWGPSLVLSEGGLPSVVWSDSRAGVANSELYLITQVTLAVNDVQSGTVVTSEPGRDLVPLAAAAGGAGALLAVALTYAGKYKLTFLAIPLYSRLKKESLLNHQVREQIFGYVNNHPGANFSQIMKELNLKNGVLAYHLNTLEREDLIKSARDGTFRRYYPRSGRGVPFEIQKTILDRIERMPGIPEGVLADELCVSRQVLAYHLDHLVQNGHVRMERRGKRNLLYTTHVAG